MSNEPEVSPLRLTELGAAPAAGKSNLSLLQQKPAGPPVVRSFEEQAGEVIRQAKEQAAQIEKDAYERGYAQGERDGQRMGEKRFEATARNLSKLLTELSGLRSEVLGQAAEDVARLALGLASAVIRAEVSCSPEVALRAATEALAAMTPDASTVVRLNPREHAYLKEAGLLPAAGRVEPDARISAGGCVAESERERFDARLERQLSVLEAALREQMTRGSEEAEDSASPSEVGHEYRQ